MKSNYPNFSVGDEVICVDPNELSYPDLIKNGKHTVLKIYEKYGRYFCNVKNLKGEISVGCHTSRFKPIKENKTDMKLKCIKNNGSSRLIVGDIYTKVDTNEHGNISVKTENGAILPHYYKPDRFIEVGEMITQSFDISKEYRTTNGCPVKIFALSEDTNYPIVGAYQTPNGRWHNQTWNLKGQAYNGSISDQDLVEVRPKRYYMSEGEGFGDQDVLIDKDAEEVCLESYIYSFDQIRKIAAEIDK